MYTFSATGNSLRYVVGVHFESMGKYDCQVDIPNLGILELENSFIQVDPNRKFLKSK